MPLQAYSDLEMEDSPKLLSPEDVFDIAVEIGKEFEKLIALYTSESVTSLMPKVLNVLELLEDFTCRSGRDNSQICELRSTISRLESEKLGKAAERESFERELQQIEENWKDETRDLLDLVSRLRDENRKLSSSLEEREETKSHVCNHEQDTKVLHRLKDAIEKQREKLRGKDKELLEIQTETESLRAQLEKITLTNKDFRRRHKATQNQTRLLIEEKAEMQAMLQEQQQCIRVLKQNLGVVQKDKEDLAKAKNSDVDLTNKVVYDLDDPNRPRFTVDELKDILFERNELKAKVSELQDEMEFFRPKSDTQKNQLDDDDDDDPPVQGPINREPDDAPWKKQESGIRKLLVSEPLSIDLLVILMLSLVLFYLFLWLVFAFYLVNRPAPCENLRSAVIDAVTRSTCSTESNLADISTSRRQRDDDQEKTSFSPMLPTILTIAFNGLFFDFSP